MELKLNWLKECKRQNLLFSVSLAQYDPRITSAENRDKRY